MNLAHLPKYQFKNIKLVLTRGVKWPALPARAKTAHTVHMLADTSAPDTSTPAAVGSGKINSNCAQPTDGQIASHRLPTNPDSDFMSTASFGGNDSNYEYVKSAENLPSRSDNTLDLVGPIRKLDTMHEVSER